MLVGVFGLYWGLLVLHPEAEATARGAAFLALVVGNLVLALADSASSGKLFAPHRTAYWAIAGLVAVVMTAVLAVPRLAAIFDVAPPDPPLLLLTLAVAAVSGGWTGVLSLLRRATR